MVCGLLVLTRLIRLEKLVSEQRTKYVRSTKQLFIVNKIGIFSLGSCATFV